MPWINGYQMLFQMTKVSCEQHDIINVYRSEGASSNLFVSEFRRLFNVSKKTFVVGDLNICYLSQRNHQLLAYLEDEGFHQLVERPTHREGRMIDHILHYSPGSSVNKGLKVVQQSPYFSDHDLLFVNEVFDFNTNLITISLYLQDFCIAEEQRETRFRSHGS